MDKIAGDAFKLIIIIVKKNLSRTVIQACKDGGAEGGTVMPGRGTGNREKASLLGVSIEPEKEIVFCLAPNDKVDSVLSEVRKKADLDKPGTGVAFVVNSSSICGIAHLLDNDFNKTE